MVLITCFMIDQIMPAFSSRWKGTGILLFGNGDLVAYDFDGNKNGNAIFKKIMEIFVSMDFSASPTFYEGKLYLPILQRDEPVHKRASKEPSRSCFA